MEWTVPVLAAKYTEEEGSYVPKMILMLNCLIPGTGTLLGGFLHDGDFINWASIGAGCFQFWTMFLLIGWFWSVWWGIRICHKTEQYHKKQMRLKKTIEGQLDNMSPRESSVFEDATQMLSP